MLVNGVAVFVAGTTKTDADGSYSTTLSSLGASDQDSVVCWFTATASGGNAGGGSGGGSGGGGVAPPAAGGLTVTVMASDGGRTSPAGLVPVESGADLTINLVANSGYVLKGVLVDGVPDVSVTEGASSMSLTGIVDSHTVVAVFGPGTLTSPVRQLALATEGGSVSPAGTSLVESGTTTPTYTLTPEPGYQLRQLLYDGQDVTSQAQAAAVGALVRASGVLTFTPSGGNVTEGHTLVAAFGPAPAASHVVAAAAATVGGTVGQRTSLIQTVTAGATYTLSIMPQAGYRVSEIRVDGTLLADQDVLVPAVTSAAPGGVEPAGGQYRIAGVAADHVITASFAATGPAKTWRISAKAGTGGTISPAGTTTVADGGSQTYTITASPGHTITAVLIDGHINAGPVSTYTFIKVSADHTIWASFSGTAAAGPPPGPPASVVKVKAATSKVTLVKGQRFKIKAKAYTNTGTTGKITGWATSKKKVATINAHGLVKAKRPGTAKITIRSGTIHAKVTVKVLKHKPAKAKVKKVSAKVPNTLKVGQTVWVTAKYPPKTAIKASPDYISSNTRIATISTVGRLVAWQPGTTRITIKAGGKKHTYTIRVTQ
jgi:hypothetical protein